MRVDIIESSEFDLDGPVLVEGLPGLGLVGTIAASYLVDKLKMDELGYIESEAFPPIAAVHNGMPLHPARIYKSKKYNMVVLISEFIIPIRAVYPLSHAILGWAIAKKVDKIISLGGIVQRGEQDEVFGIASTPELAEKTAASKIKLIREGATTGVNGVLLSDCASRGFPAVSLLAEAKQEQMDPRGAALVIEALKRLTGIDIDTSDLRKESEELEVKMSAMMEKARAAGKRYREAEELGSMYG
ncbi:MAG: proteasome assembly chaperone family protein [Candidatus ainarchaeum sp.]|nr:proteasome assembly chaperone family protein [Candidatus ainarchaeum sp.]